MGTPLIRQSEATECGLACIAMVARHYGYDTDLMTLRRRFPISMKGATLKSLIEIGAGIGLGARAVRCELEELKDLRRPAILHWDLNHFVVLKQVKGDRALILDPAQGERLLPLKIVSKHFTGVALELTPTDKFKRKQEKVVLKLMSLVRFSPETIRATLQAILVSLVIQAFLLATPFYMQLVIDQAILKGDAGLLTALAIGFGAVTVFQVIAQVLRDLTLQFLGAVMSFDMESRLFHHLLRLPLDWFHKRQVGDVQNRFGSIEPIKHFVAGGALAALLDGVLGLFTCALMFYFAPFLAVIVIVSVALYVVMRFTMLNLSRKVAGDLIMRESKEQTSFLETLRAAQTIKIAANEGERENLQRNNISATVKSSVRAAHVDIGYRAANQALSGLTDIVVVFLGALAVIDANMTVGMLTAFMAYKGRFAAQMATVVETVIQWRLLDVHLGRIGDIALAHKEPRIDEEGLNIALRGEIELRNVLFRYAPGEPEVLKGASVKIAAGEFVAIAGPSGSGKSTFLKILTGLYQPQYGEVLIDGRPAASWGPRHLRRQLGVVAQDDQLLQGSIAENIALFDERIDMDRVEAAAKLAAIHNDIAKMPMGYQSLVGDMGSALSGGQKQRIMIARALYRRPRILIMDEGTSNLDVNTEAAINAALQRLQVTRVVVAHRPETLRAADRVLALYKGVLIPVGAPARKLKQASPPDPKPTPQAAE
ncbi:MAG: peptidase domain-containing ABC transporter [Maricaulaceae bacterium]